MNMADRIQNLRKTRGITQEELADKIGISRQAVSKWESEQSTPDLDKVIIMSDFFEVTTDYLLKGVESIRASEKSGAALASQILYITSTALVAIGLLCGIANWYEYQAAQDVGGAMIIQAVGIVAYFIARVVSQVKPPFYVNLLNIGFVLFMPISMTTGLLSIALFKQGWVAPYPIGIWHSILFVVVYLLACVSTFTILRKRTN